MRIEPTAFDSRPRAKQVVASSPCGLIGLIETSFLGTQVTRRGHRSHSGAPPSPSHLGTTQVGEDLALVYTNHNIMYLGFEIPLGSPGMCPVTSSPVQRGGAEIPLLRALQVSSCLDVL